jgi:transcriptional regulator with XRE-family HTH domain
MLTGRKILNLRCDRKISQQDLARACLITPSALSKIEAGINSPRAPIIWRISKQLGVTVEYLMDESMPYPYQGYLYRQDLYSSNVDPKSMTRMDATREEKAFLKALRESNHIAREVAMAIPETSVEVLRMIHFLIHSEKLNNPTATLLSKFEKMFAAPAKKTTAAAAPAKRKKSKAAKTAAKKH